MDFFSAPVPPRDFFQSTPNERDLREFLDFEFKVGGFSLGKMAIRYPETRERLVEECLQHRRPDLASKILRKTYYELFARPLVCGLNPQRLQFGVELLFTELTGKQLHLRKASTFSLLYQTHCELPQKKIKENHDVIFSHSFSLFRDAEPFDSQMMINIVATLFVLDGNRFLSQSLRYVPPDILTSLKRKLGPERCSDYAEELIFLQEMYEQLQSMKVLDSTFDRKPLAKRLYERFFPSPPPILKEPNSNKKNN